MHENDCANRDRAAQSKCLRAGRHDLRETEFITELHLDTGSYLGNLETIKWSRQSDLNR